MATNEDRAYAREDVRKKKEAYKQAKRAAGMSNAPKIAAAVIGAVAILATGSYGGYSFAVASNDNLVALQQQLNSSAQSSDETQSDDVGNTGGNTESANGGETVSDTDDGEVTGEDTAQQSDETEVDSDTSDDSSQATNALVGQWTASFMGTTGGTGKCYGGRAMPLSLEVESVDSSGIATFNASVLFHGHKINNSYSDWDESKKDEVLNVYGLQGNFNSTLVFTAAKSEGKNATVRISGDPDSGELTAVVESYNNTTDPVEVDEYTLVKE